MVAIPNPGKHPTRRQRDQADRESLQQLPPDAALQQLFRWLLGTSGRRCRLATAALAQRGGPAVVSGLSTVLLQRPTCPEEVQSRCLAVLELMNPAPTRDLTVALELLAESGTDPIRLRASAVAAKLGHVRVPLRLHPRPLMPGEPWDASRLDEVVCATLAAVVEHTRASAGLTFAPQPSPTPAPPPTPPCAVTACRVRLSQNPAGAAPALDATSLNRDQDAAKTMFSPDDMEDIRRLRGLTGAEVRRDVLGWFAGTDKRRCRLATAMLIGLGERVLPDMTEALMYGSARPDLQLSVLNVVAQIGGRPTPELATALMSISMFGPLTRLSLEAALVLKRLYRYPAPVTGSQPITTTPVSEDLNDLHLSGGEKANGPLNGLTGAGTPAAQHALADGDGIEGPAKSARREKPGAGGAPPKHPDDPIAGFVPDKGGWDGPRLDLAAACAACSQPVGRVVAVAGPPPLQAETPDAGSPPGQGPLLQTDDGGRAGQNGGPE